MVELWGDVSWQGNLDLVNVIQLTTFIHVIALLILITCSKCSKPLTELIHVLNVMSWVTLITCDKCTKPLTGLTVCTHAHNSITLSTWIHMIRSFDKSISLIHVIHLIKSSTGIQYIICIKCTKVRFGVTDGWAMWGCQLAVFTKLNTANMFGKADDCN